MNPVIEIQNMIFQYGKDPLFNELSLNVNPGLYGLLGKNGAGKSTLLKIISGQLYPHGGSCLTLGDNPADRKPSMLSKMYYLPEDISVPEIKGKNYVDLNAPFYPDFSMKIFDRSLKLFEVPSDKKLNTLSFGQKKKFLIAFALATNCPLILLDEPTNGLDIPSKSQFRQVAASMDLERQAMVISTHQVRDMEMLIDPIIIVEKGKIILNKSMDEILNSYHIEHQTEEPAPGEAVYWEKGLAGYTVVKEGPSDEDKNMDLEFLFNLTIAKGGIS
ncbi:MULTISPECIES: ATP-binding cassette domain-containing protein [unclassified Oceanispirochaeta]|uniref:ABC transporter ATP-binding protein n=1 Tax=unclassified Oceanispirochaeta TaxID=2635722 RepID=UPI000E097A44|nr:MULTISPECIES: ABC transporter ATP-binding protein [unclassified Oceanispirochaeta]MBF9017348.1 ABC transporter ATP-binding protein [Oceanispirochaeta sp. M2]NPD73723.1 ABC transporter ATP-binding protein [Oceanispirochaeta sp. M1]RDG30476.1 ABC transporter ATP-binding protein [Oceanispirochaeta sp. M1]